MSPTPAHILIGVDGGGTGCRAAIGAADGTSLGAARGGAANFLSDPDMTVRNVRDAILRAARAASLPESALAGATAHIGVAGILNDSHAEMLAAAMPFGNVTVTDDRPTSTRGALGAQDGVLAAIGTGSFVVARRGDRMQAFGGWGLQVGDQASGAWLGRAALERCLLVQDGLEADSALMHDLRARHGNDPVEIVAFAKQARASDYAALAPMIVSAAASGDINGVALMCAGAGYLDRCLTQAGVQGADVLCLTGGLGPHYAPYLDSKFRTRIRPAAGTALDGALLLARDRHANARAAE